MKDEIQAQAKERKYNTLHLQAKTEARSAQEHDRSDVFTYDRTYSRIMNGVGVEYGKPS